MKIFFQIYTFLLTISYLLTSCSPVSLPTPMHQRDIESITELSKIWTLDNVYITQERFSPMTGATEGKFCFLGNLSNKAERKVICLDGANGNLLWEHLASSSSAFALSPDGVFIGTNGIASLAHYNLDGNFIWDASFTGNGVIRVYIVGNEVQVFNHPERLRVFDIQTGDLIKKIDGDTTYIVTGTEKFIYTYSLQSVDINTKTTKWEADVKGYIRMTPFFTKNAIYVRTGEIMGRVYAINRGDGNTLWNTGDNIISNIAYSPERGRIYILTRDGKLVSVDINSGNTSTLIQFSNPPFILNGEQQVGGYEVAYDESANILFVTLGDSRQLFAFQEK